MFGYLGETFTTLFVNDSGSNQVTVIDTKDNQVLATLPTGVQPQGVGIDEKTGYAYVSNQGSATVTVVKVSPK